MKKSRSILEDPDMKMGGRALRRASAKALELARRTGTPFYIYENGQIVNLLARRRPKKSTGRRSA